VAVRRRRTAEESRAIILQVAESRLRKHGLEGLNIKGVAEEAGLSHATLIHHFGSSGGMRDALSEKMSVALVGDLTDALGSHVPPGELIQNVFDALASGGHAKLLAWRAVEGHDTHEDNEVVVALFSRLLAATREVLEVETDAQARQMIYLVAIAAIGHGLAGNMLAQVLGMNEEDVEAFPAWMTGKLT